jgi:hypothetical protein
MPRGFYSTPNNVLFLSAADFNIVIQGFFWEDYYLEFENALFLVILLSHII